MKLLGLKLGTKLTAGFGFILVLMTVIVLISVAQISLLDSKVAVLANKRMAQLQFFYEIMKQYDNMARSASNIALTIDEAVQKHQEGYYKTNKAAVAENLNRLEKTLTNAKGKEAMGRIKEAEALVWPLYDKAVEFGRANKNSEAGDIIMVQVLPVQAKFLSAMDDLAVAVQSASDDDAKSARTLSVIGGTVIVILGLAALVFGGLVAFLITRSITKPINHVVTGLTEADVHRRLGL